MKRVCRCAAIGVSLALAVALASSAAAVEPVTNSAGASPRLKYLPANYWFVGECNVGVVMQLINTPEAQQNPQYAQFKAAMQMVTMMTGIDPEREIAWVTMFSAGTPGDAATALFVIQGSFNNDVVEPRLAGMQQGGAPPTTYKNFQVYSSQDVEMCFPEPSTLIVGDGALVMGAIDALDGATKGSPPELQNVLDRTPADSVVWAAVAPRALLGLADLGWRTANAQLYSELTKLDCASAYFTLADDGLLVKSLGYVGEPGGAASLGQYLQGRKDDILHRAGSNVVFTSLLVLAEVSSSGEHVEGSLRLTAAAMEELWNTRVVVKPK